MEKGLRNSVFIAPMPTASTSGIMCNSHSIEPFNSLIYNRKVGAGDITLINKYLVNDLIELGLWNKNMSDKILANDGSIQTIYEIPKKIRDIYLTAYDMTPKDWSTEDWEAFQESEAFARAVAAAVLLAPVGRSGWNIGQFLQNTYTKIATLRLKAE